MPNYVLEGILISPPPAPQEEVDRLLAGHKEWVASWLREGRVLVAGPRAEGGGGFVLVRADSRAQLDAYIRTDPYYQRGIIRYQINEFMPIDHQAYAADWAAE